MSKSNKIADFFSDKMAFVIVLGVALLCAVFLIYGTKAEDGSITLDGSNAKIEQYTKDFIEDANAALNRIMNEDRPTDDETILANSEEATGKGFYTTIDDILARRLPAGSKEYQCSRYTAYLGTGKSIYSTTHPDYGPVNGKDVAAWLVENYDFKYIDTPVTGAIGSGGFNTTYGHTALYLYSTGANTAMVEDANYVPLAVSTHNMDISGWVWVVPGSYVPAPEPTPEPTPTPTPEPTPSYSCGEYSVQYGDTLGAIMLGCEGHVDWTSMNDYAKLWVSTITNPGQSVYDGWNSGYGVGLYSGDVIKYIGN